MKIFKYIFFTILPSFAYTSCNSKEEKEFFMRYESTDYKKLNKDIGELYMDLDFAKEEIEKLDIVLDLSEKLFISKREKEAIRVLKPFIINSKLETSKENFTWLYLNYATASQYDNNKEEAEEYFNRAIAVVENDNLVNIEHYVYHHYGRFLVEQRNYELARLYFLKALKIRRKLNDSHLVSSIKALEELEMINENN